MVGKGLVLDLVAPGLTSGWLQELFVGLALAIDDVEESIATAGLVRRRSGFAVKFAVMS